MIFLEGFELFCLIVDLEQGDAGWMIDQGAKKVTFRDGVLSIDAIGSDPHTWEMDQFG